MPVRVRSGCMSVPLAAVVPSALVDPFGRTIDYLRLAVTDRCNLRCSYCMPESGVIPVSRVDIMTFEEALRLCALLVRMGVRKIRVTGGEPLVRRGTVGFIARLGDLTPRPEVLLTTNGVLLAGRIDALKTAGVSRVNLSLDSLDAATWTRITRRTGFAEARGAIDALLAAGLGVKVNTVVLEGVNDGELADFVALTRDLPIEVRFIEAMGFDGAGGRIGVRLPGPAILAALQDRFALVAEPDPRRCVARTFRVPGHAGTIGIIEGHARTFCGNCNRLRLDAQGRLRTCLYGAPQVDLLAMLRAGAPDEDIAAVVRASVARRASDGHAAERALIGANLASMASIGG